MNFPANNSEHEFFASYGIIEGAGLANPAIVVGGFGQVRQSGAGCALAAPVPGDAVNRTFAAGDFGGDGRADIAALHRAQPHRLTVLRLRHG